MSIAWLQITATTDRSALAEAVFEHWGAEAITELDAGSALTVELTPNSRPAFQQSRVVGLFTHGTDPAPIVSALHEVLGADGRVNTETLENQDWASAWLARHPPLRFGRRLWIAPHSAPLADDAETDDDTVVVRLDPGLAFGTGTHPTTALCLRWLADQDLAGRTVLDYGCGSGILSIAAAGLGARRVVAVDIDDQALRATRENAGRNGVGDIITTPAMDAIADGPFDIVVANILAQPLIDLATTLADHARAGASLVLSGLLTRQIGAVLAAYEADFAFEAPAVEDDWTRLSGRRS